MNQTPNPEPEGIAAAEELGDWQANDITWFEPAVIVLVDLDGRHGPVKTLGFTTAAQAIAILKVGLAATAADDNGALNVWHLHDGRFICARYRYGMERERLIAKTLPEVRKWITKQLRKIR